MQKVEERDLYDSIVGVFQELDSQSKLGMSPSEAADILMAPLENEVAFKSAEHFLGLQIDIVDAFAQRRIEYQGIDLGELHRRLLPIFLRNGVFGSNRK